MRKDQKTGVIIGIAIVLLFVIILSFLTSEEPEPLESFETPEDTETETIAEQETTVNNTAVQSPQQETSSETDQNKLDIPKTLPPRLKELKKTLDIDTIPAKSKEAIQKTEPIKPRPKPKTITHTVSSGDTLSSISQKYYGEPTKWRIILDTNPNLENPHSLKIGQEIKIPPLP